jgi:hypothetical protein
MLKDSVITVRGFHRTVRYKVPRTSGTGPSRRKEFPVLPVPARPEEKISKAVIIRLFAFFMHIF